MRVGRLGVEYGNLISLSTSHFTLLKVLRDSTSVCLFPRCPTRPEPGSESVVEFLPLSIFLRPRDVNVSPPQTALPGFFYLRETGRHVVHVMRFVLSTYRVVISPSADNAWLLTCNMIAVNVMRKGKVGLESGLSNAP